MLQAKKKKKKKKRVVIACFCLSTFHGLYRLRFMFWFSPCRHAFLNRIAVNIFCKVFSNLTKEKLYKLIL